MSLLCREYAYILDSDEEAPELEDNAVQLAIRESIDTTYVTNCVTVFYYMTQPITCVVMYFSLITSYRY